MKLIAPLLSAALLAVGSGAAVMAEEAVYTVKEMDVFTDLDGVKRIVTQVNGDGSFSAESVGDWLRSCNDYTMFELPSSYGYALNCARYYYTDSIVMYSRNPEVEDGDSSPIQIDKILSEEDVIRTDAENEIVEIVCGIGEDGSVYTETLSYEYYYYSYAEEEEDMESLYELRNWEADAIDGEVKVGDICSMQTVEDISEKEIVVQVYEDGSFDTKPLGVWLDESEVYEKEAILTETGSIWKIFYYPTAAVSETDHTAGQENLQALSVGDIIRVYDSTTETVFGETREVERVAAISSDNALMTVSTAVTAYLE